MKLMSSIAAFLLYCALSTAADAAALKLVGNWRLHVSCRDFTQINTVSVSEATGERVLGTTNVEDGFGKIVGGSFDGENVKFINKYKWNGRTYTETWRGKLSRNGSYLSGAFSTNNTDAGGCRFRGSRL